jgi:hypothetical protein
MRVEQSNQSFQPVTITLDSQHEVDTLIELMGIAYNNSSSGSDVERMADDIRNQMNNSGWQSSSYNC